MQVLKKGCIRDGLGNRRGTKSAQSVHRACTKGEQRRNKEGTKREQKGIFGDFGGYKKGAGTISRGAHKEIAKDNYINIYRKNKSFLYR